MSQTQYANPVLEEEENLECQASGLPHLVLTSGPFDDDGGNEDCGDGCCDIKAEAEED